MVTRFELCQKIRPQVKQMQLPVAAGHIYQQRVAAGMSQRELAEKVGCTSSAIISMWENGVKFPNPTHIVRLWNVLGGDLRLYLPEG